jgi:hypothetical protein
MLLSRLCPLLLAIWLPAAFAASVSLQKSAGQIEVKIDGKTFTTFYYGPETPKPYLHPLHAADGTRVTRLYPMQDVEGETKDHPHHRGLWFTHGDVNGLDFWANEPTLDPAKRGLVVMRSVDTDDAAGSIRGVFEWRAPDGKALLTEERTMVFNGDAKLRTVDLDVTFRAGSQTVKFGDTKEGTFAIRLATPLEEPTPRSKGVPRTGKIVNSEGKTGESETWGKRAAWVDYSGKIDGKPLGVAIFDHPGNPKHPTYWHVRSYGLFAANPYGEHDYYADPKRDGSITLAPGETTRFRYRVLIHPGDTQQSGIAELYQQYVKSGAR